MYFPGNILLYELIFRTSYLLKRWWIPAVTPQIEKTLYKQKKFCTLVQLSSEITKQEWWGFRETLRLIFRHILVHEMHLENDALLAKLWKVSNIFIMTVLHCVWRRMFLGVGPSSTWISFQEGLNFWILEGENGENRTQKSESQKGGTVGLFLAGFLYLRTCTSEQITTTLLGGAKLKDKSRQVILEV